MNLKTVFILHLKKNSVKVFSDQCAYRDAAVTEDWIANHDCVKNFEAKLMEQGVITADEISQMRADFDREMDEAILRAEAAPEMKPEEIYDNLYV